MKTPKVIPEKGFYYHYKHDPKGLINNYSYEILGISKHTEDDTYTVIYRPLYESEWMKLADFQSRPLDMFTEHITKEGKTFPRFQKITDQKIIAQLEDIKKKMYGMYF